MPDTIVNIVDFGAIPGGAGFANVNAIAFRSALATGSRRIFIPAGSWWFNELILAPNQWLPFGVEVFGEGVNLTVLNYLPVVDTVPFFKAYPGSSTPPYARSTFHDFTVYGRVTPAVNTPPVGTAFDLDNALFVRIRDVNIWYFDTAVSFNQGVSLTYSAYHVIERFEVNGCATGIRMGQSSNGLTIQNGRVWSSVVQYDGSSSGGAREVGTGIDISGVVGTTGPAGGTGVVISQVVVEGTPLCVRIRNCSDLSIIGCYFEPGLTGAGFGTARRRILDIDAVSERLHIVGCETSETSNPGAAETWTPTYANSPPEARTALEQDSFPGSGTGPNYRVNGYGAGLHGATAANANRIKNADMSRGTLFWPTANAFGGTQIVDSSSVISGASLRLTVGTNPTFHMSQDFVLNAGLRSVTVCVRYRLLTPGVNAFRFDLFDVATSTTLGFFSDTSSASTFWQTRALTGRFDGLAGGVTGPRTLRVRIYPYNGSGALAAQQVLIDSVWLIDGEYSAPYRPYAEGIEMLRGNDRVIFLSFTNRDIPYPPTSILPGPPANAVGVIVEMRIRSTAAASNLTYLTVDDNEGSSQTRDLYAYANNRWSMTDYLLPITPGAVPALQPQWSMTGANAGNLVDLEVRAKAWILRL